jgi:hypothetical protein
MNLRQLIARFRREERGNVLIMAGLGAFTLVGGAGLATDATQWFLWKREIQMAADAGALAAAHTLAQGSTAITAPAAREIERNRDGTYTTEFIGTRPRTGAFINDATAAEVVLTTQRRLPFSGLFRRTAPIVRARAVAAKVIKSDNCVISLATTGKGVEVQGNASIRLGCGVSANSTDAQAIYLQGSAFLNATTLAAVGNIDPKEGSLSTGTEQLPFAPAQTDPFGPQGAYRPRHLLRAQFPDPAERRPGDLVAGPLLRGHDHKGQRDLQRRCLYH